MDTSWARAVRNGEQPDPAALQAHLLAVHREHAGFTEDCAWACRDDQGRNSYEWLCEVVSPAQHHHVLDLACGSGVLGALCQQRYADRLRITGVDMSGDELALARDRLAGVETVSLFEAMAQDMPFLQDDAVDAVLCHWALTLMDPVEPVLQEVRRVLRPGGSFAAIVDGDMAASDSYQALHDLIYDHVRVAVPGYGTVDLGDARVRTSDELQALLREVFPDGEVITTPGVVRLQAPPDVLARQAVGFFYAAFVLEAPARDRLLSAVAAFFAERALMGDPGFAMPINRIQVTVAGAARSESSKCRDAA